MRLNVGCGEFMAPGWWNVDVVLRENHYNIKPDQVIDVREPLPENIEMLTMVYMGHFLEHIQPDQINPMLNNVKSRMLPGAMICIVGPDVNRASEMYWAGRIDEDLWRHTQAGAGAKDWEGDFHYWDCNERDVATFLMEAGFADVRILDIVTNRELTAWPVVARDAWQCAVIGEVGS